MATPKNHSVIKAFAILKAFQDAEGWLSSCELSRRANLPQASGYRLIQTMEDIGVITRGKRGQYRPGLLLLSISRGVPWLEVLQDASRPILTSLATSLDLTTHLAILENGAVTCIGKYCSVTSVPLHTRIGAQLDYSSGLGKVLLAGSTGDEIVLFHPGEELEAVRKRGFATDDRESHARTRCTAVPVKDSHGRIIAAISAGDEASRVTPAREGKIRQALFEASASLQSALYRRRTA